MKLTIEGAKNYNKNYYIKNKTRTLNLQKERRKRNREWFQNFKSNLKCIRCDENNSVCLDFHHRDCKEKDFEVSDAIARGFSQKRLLEEIAKCDVLCANCHRKEHAKDIERIYASPTLVSYKQ